MIERLSQRTIALGAASLLGLAALGGCAQKGNLAAGNTCYTDFMGNVKDKDGKTIAQVNTTILKLLENTLVQKTHSEDTSGYKGTGDTSERITNTYITQYSDEGKDISLDPNEIANTKPFNKAMFSFCIDASGEITPGEKPGITPESDPRDRCIMIYDKYAQVAREHPEQLEADCGIKLN